MENKMAQIYKSGQSCWFAPRHSECSSCSDGINVRHRHTTPAIAMEIQQRKLEQASDGEIHTSDLCLISYCRRWCCVFLFLILSLMESFIAQWLERATSIRKTRVRISSGLRCVFRLIQLSFLLSLSETKERFLLGMIPTRASFGWSLCALRHGIQISIHAKAVWTGHPATGRSTECLDSVAKSCKLWRICTGPSEFSIVGRCVLVDLDLDNLVTSYWKRTDSLVKSKMSHAVPVMAS